MDFSDFVRKPFVVEAVEVTEENIAEIAPHVGRLREKADGTPYIQVDRRLIPNVFQVFPGYWMTRMGDNIRCYSKKVFTDQFVRKTDDMSDWIDYLNNAKAAAVPSVREF